MATEEQDQDNQDEQLDQATDKEQASAGFIISMTDEEYSLLFPEFDFDEGVYVKARPTDVDEDEIFNKSMTFRYQSNTRKRPDSPEDMDVSATVSTAAAFIAKCEAQITDFRLPVRWENGEEGMATYTASGSVAERDNRNLYRYLLKNQPVRERIEGFLDFIAGRDTAAKQDFEDLKNEQPQLLKTS